ncbi:minor capsid protein, partial [Desulfocapsa sp. AH-315-G09]|nr:minor capsid protein [Desulfocapsa sp. AH-315-G09]
IQIGAGQFNKLSAEAKLRAFAVSGIAKGDELNTVFTALQKGIDRGDSFGKFKKECADIFERRGWKGKRAWRIDNIYRTNIQTAYNVGRYKQLQEESSVFPYWQYDAVNDKRTRPTHLAMDGRVWPKDHPVWNTWYPPNGYRCRCSVIGLTRGAVERRKIEVEKEDITERLIEPVSPVSGEKMPGRQMLPDIGFEHNPGQVYWAQFAQVLIDRLKTYPGGLALMVEKDLSETKALTDLLEAAESSERDLDKETTTDTKS